MGFMSCMGPCVGCRAIFSFNPDLVPSLRVNGVKEPVCRSCMNKVNEERKRRALEPFPIMDGAYDAQEEM